MAPAAAATTLATAGTNSLGSTLAIAAVGAAMGSMFAGLFDNGGYIPGGKFGIAGEVGPEIVQGPAYVTSRKDTAKIFNQSSQQSSGSAGETLNVVVNDNKVINVQGSSEEQRTQLLAALELNNQQLVAQISKDIGRGQGPVYSAMRKAG